MSNEHEVDVSECWFFVKLDDKILLKTSDYKQAFEHKKMVPGSKVFVEAKVDATIEAMQNLAQGGVFGEPETRGI